MFGQQENENEREGKTEQGSVYSIYLYILHLHPSLYILQWMHGNIYREVFPTFLPKKSYDWWIPRRRMEIYTKMSKRKDLKWSRRNRGEFAPRMGWCEFSRCYANFAQAWSSFLPKAISSSFQLQIIHGLKPWILNFLSFEMVYSMQKMDFEKCSKSAKEDCSCCPLFSSLCLFFLFASLLYLACLNDPKSCQNTKTSHKYDQKSLLGP